MKNHYHYTKNMSPQGKHISGRRKEYQTHILKSKM